RMCEHVSHAMLRCTMVPGVARVGARSQRSTRMAWLAEVPGMGAAEDRVKKALSFPLGVASPLWIAFGAAASAGVAYWWMTRWTKAANLEAAFALARAPITETVEVVEIIAEVVEAETEAVLEALTPEP